MTHVELFDWGTQQWHRLPPLGVRRWALACTTLASSEAKALLRRPHADTQRHADADEHDDSRREQQQQLLNTSASDTAAAV
jgi:hypothetical protein